MQDNHEQIADHDETAGTFVEGLDFYFDEGMMVLTRRYLQNRGNCCESKCRHCPYGRDAATG
ncbi:MAG: DUF5522 domain-containing protein [Pyrinomonadaceae bacterium]